MYPGSLSRLVGSFVSCGVCILTFPCCLLPSAWCDDAPSADYIFPAGGQRGTTVEFRVGAHFLHGGCPFELSGPGLETSERIERTETTWFEGPLIVKPASQGAESYPKDHAGTVRIAADAPTGIRYWRLWTSQGAVAGKPFIVGDLPEIVEREIDGRAVPEPVTLPVTINGRMFPREDIDIWEFEAEAGQPVTCEVFASRMGSPLNSRLEVYGPNGRLVAENYDHFGSDSFVQFRAEQAGTYRVHICDSTFKGLQEYVYRLTITAGTRIDRVFPLGGRIGTKTKFEAASLDAPNRKVEVDLPATGDGDHLLYLPLGEALSNPVTIELSDLDEHIESEAVADNASAISVPAVLNGRIQEAGETDRWTICPKEDQHFDFKLWTARFGSPLDAVLTISDSDGNQLTQVASTPDNPIQPSTTVTLSAGKNYAIEIKDCFDDRGGPQYAYRLRIGRPPVPKKDFRLQLPSDALTVIRGTEAKVKVAVERVAGFAGEISLSATDLPEGVTAETLMIPADKNEVEFVFKAGEKAHVRGSHIGIEGTAAIDEETRTNRATLTGLPGATKRDDVLLVVAMPTPFKISGVEFQTGYAARGTVHRRRFVIDRGDFTGPLTLSLADRQIRHLQGVTAAPMHVAPDTKEVYFQIHMPTWLEMNRTGRTVVMAVGEVEDEQGNKHKVSFSSGHVHDQIITLTAPCPLNVTSTPRSLRADPGTTAELRVRVSRGVLQQQPVKVELVVPEHFTGVSSEAITIPVNSDNGILNIEFTEQSTGFNMPATIRATTMVDGDPVIAESSIEFVDLKRISLNSPSRR